MLLSVSTLKAQKSEIKQFKLDNGLTIILNEDHTKKEVFGMLVVKAGAKNDPKDATGMAHYQEHMLFKGTTELGTSDWEKRNRISIVLLRFTTSWGKPKTIVYV